MRGVYWWLLAGLLINVITIYSVAVELGATKALFCGILAGACAGFLSAVWIVLYRLEREEEI